LVFNGAPLPRKKKRKKHLYHCDNWKKKKETNPIHVDEDKGERKEKEENPKTPAEQVSKARIMFKCKAPTTPRPLPDIISIRVHTSLLFYYAYTTHYHHHLLTPHSPHAKPSIVQTANTIVARRKQTLVLSRSDSSPCAPA
jgi:hypothetical protein